MTTASKSAALTFSAGASGVTGYPCLEEYSVAPPPTTVTFAPAPGTDARDTQLEILVEVLRQYGNAFPFSSIVPPARRLPEFTHPPAPPFFERISGGLVSPSLTVQYMGAPSFAAAPSLRVCPENHPSGKPTRSPTNRIGKCLLQAKLRTAEGLCATSMDTYCQYRGKTCRPTAASPGKQEKSGESTRPRGPGVRR